MIHSTTPGDATTVDPTADSRTGAMQAPASAGDAAHAFLARIAGCYDIRGALLFGSRARGDHATDSDADLAVLLRGPLGRRSLATWDMAGVAFDIMLETGILIDPLPLSEEEWEHPETFPNPALINAIRRDGIAL